MSVSYYSNDLFFIILGCLASDVSEEDQLYYPESLPALNVDNYNGTIDLYYFLVHDIPVILCATTSGLFLSPSVNQLISPCINLTLFLSIFPFLRLIRIFEGNSDTLFSKTLN